MKLLNLIIAAALLFTTSCGGGGDDSPPPPTPPAELELGAFSLVFPENNEVCTEGEDVGTDMITIVFRWGSSSNATSYKIEVTQDTGQKFEATTTSTSAPLTVPKGTQFTWNVSAIREDKTKAGNTDFNFYSEGITESNHTPFPASITLEDNMDGTINIVWVGSDIDNDIENYDIMLGTTPEPSAILENTTSTRIDNQAINYDTIYYLNVVTKDQHGNSSNSKKQFNFKN
ncbi:hypothetical protein [Spongiivirga citrea]|uniref:Fibronectin type-III domain-containing protein n=1 Tax=Spongiivirga citrea TaxID=1481457 RepID=A0A6M0CJG1_9FLAO|nr:hypothetical protein [Spongiivirga citrea]NER18075.1 hypothetical protein [Spongiivirga citrea]